MPHILIVSTAHSCRSPYAAILLADRLHSRGDLAWSVSSAGTHARLEETLCLAVSERLTSQGLSTEVMAHDMHQLTPEDVHSADLVLTAGAEHRADVARLEPRASMRTFTMREFVRLGALLPAPVGMGGGRIPVADMVAELHSARHLLGAPHLERHTPMPRFSTVGIDIVDGHHGSSGAHRQALRSVHESAERIADLLLTAG